MARQGETPINISAPVAAPPPQQEETPNRSATAKRQRDDGDEIPGPLSTADLQPIKRRIVSPQDILFRILVPSREIGKVIGKGGYRVQKVRDDTKATIKIADAIARGEERVILIGSKDSENFFSDAENALHQIGSLILMETEAVFVALSVAVKEWNIASSYQRTLYHKGLLSFEGQKDDGSEKIGTGHVAANTIRLLISGCQAGAIIGVSGQNIEKLRNSSGATITVLAQSQLPLCASAHESDRVVQMSGDVPAVLRALVEIGCQLRENPPKQIISISPAYNIGFHRPPHQYVDPNSAEYVALEMMIPETYMGGLIGRCGSNISRIRTESGATIKVHGGKGEQNQRQISLGGNAQQVAVAKQRIDEYLYSQMIQQTGVQQSVVANPVMMPAQPPTYYAAAPPQAPLPYYVAPSYHTPQL